VNEIIDLTIEEKKAVPIKDKKKRKTQYDHTDKDETKSSKRKSGSESEKRVEVPVKKRKSVVHSDSDKDETEKEGQTRTHGQIAISNDSSSKGSSSSSFFSSSSSSSSSSHSSLDVDGYAMWDIMEISPKDKDEMLRFCRDFKRETNIVDERVLISVPLESLSPCFHKLFSENNFETLSKYMGSSPLIVGVEIVQDPPYAQRQQVHTITSIGFGLSLTLEIVFEGFVTTWLIPGSHKRHLDVRTGKKRAQLIQQKRAQLIQPCIQQSTCAMVYDTSISHCYAETHENVASFRMLIKFEAMLSKGSENTTTPRYYFPGEHMTNKDVVEFINKEMGQNLTERYDFRAFHGGDIRLVQQFTAVSDTKVDEGGSNTMISKVCLCVCLCVYLWVCLCVYLSILSVRVCVCWFVCLCLSACLSVYLSG
jgi:hypothetical protein